jgi:uncharacterized protein (DUF2147 family)
MKRMNSFMMCAFVMFITVGQLIAQNAEADRIVGVWVPSHGKARVKIEKIGNKYFGKTIWLKTPNDPATGKPSTDKMNPDESLRSQPRLGLRIMKDFVYEGKGIWEDGSVYDPEKGKTYCGKITFVDNDHIELRGHICFMPFLGRTDTWTRFKE